MKLNRRPRYTATGRKGKPPAFAPHAPQPTSPSPASLSGSVLIVRADGAVVAVGAQLDQIYSFEDETGEQWHWSIAQGMTLAQARGDLGTISLQEMGITIEFIRQQYDAMDEEYALTTDLRKPLLFVPFKGKVRLIDGWHKLFHAAAAGVDILYAYFLTQEEADACLVCYLPPGQGLDWGQRPRGK